MADGFCMMMIYHILTEKKNEKKTQNKVKYAAYYNYQIFANIAM